MESVGAKWWVCSIFFSYPSIADFEITLEKKIPSLDETRAVLKIIKLYSNILDKNKRRAAKSAPPGRLIKILIRQKLLMYGNFQFFWKNLWYAMPITKTFLGQRQNIFQKKPWGVSRNFGILSLEHYWTTCRGRITNVSGIGSSENFWRNIISVLIPPSIRNFKFLFSFFEGVWNNLQRKICEPYILWVDWVKICKISKVCTSYTKWSRSSSKKKTKFCYSLAF